jgi:astacin (peptidase family M12A)
MEDAMPEGFLTGGTTDTTWIKPLGSGWKEVTYAAVDGLAVFEGCIILGTVTEAQAVKEFIRRNPGLTQPDVETFGTAIVGKQFRWKNNILPFEIDPALPNQQRVTDAIKHWQDNTPIRFVARNEADPAHRDFVVFRAGSGCASNVGRRGGRQDVILGSACTAGNCIHEIGHTVGLWHEQSRADRDSFITVRLDHVIENARHNFNQHIQDGMDLGAYDYESIMHYPRDAFSEDGEDTIIPTQPGVEIGQRRKLSTGDIAAVNKLITT